MSAAVAGPPAPLAGGVPAALAAPMAAAGASAPAGGDAVGGGGAAGGSGPGPKSKRAHVDAGWLAYEPLAKDCARHWELLRKLSMQFFSQEELAADEELMRAKDGGGSAVSAAGAAGGSAAVATLLRPAVTVTDDTGSACVFADAEPFFTPTPATAAPAADATSSSGGGRRGSTSSSLGRRTGPAAGAGGGDFAPAAAGSSAAGASAAGSAIGSVLSQFAASTTSSSAPPSSASTSHSALSPLPAGGPRTGGRPSDPRGARSTDRSTGPVAQGAATSAKTAEVVLTATGAGGAATPPPFPRALGYFSDGDDEEDEVAGGDGNRASPHAGAAAAMVVDCSSSPEGRGAGSGVSRAGGSGVSRVGGSGISRCRRTSGAPAPAASAGAPAAAPDAPPPPPAAAAPSVAAAAKSLRRPPAPAADFALVAGEARLLFSPATGIASLSKIGENGASITLWADRVAGAADMDLHARSNVEREPSHAVSRELSQAVSRELSHAVFVRSGPNSTLHLVLITSSIVTADGLSHSAAAAGHPYSNRMNSQFYCINAETGYVVEVAAPLAGGPVTAFRAINGDCCAFICQGNWLYVSDATLGRKHFPPATHLRHPGPFFSTDLSCLMIGAPHQVHELRLFRAPLSSDARLVIVLTDGTAFGLFRGEWLRLDGLQWSAGSIFGALSLEQEREGVEAARAGREIAPCADDFEPVRGLQLETQRLRGGGAAGAGAGAGAGSAGWTSVRHCVAMLDCAAYLESSGEFRVWLRSLVRCLMDAEQWEGVLEFVVSPLEALLADPSPAAAAIPASFGAHVWIDRGAFSALQLPPSRLLAEDVLGPILVPGAPGAAEWLLSLASHSDGSRPDCGRPAEAAKLPPGWTEARPGAAAVARLAALLMHVARSCADSSSEGARDAQPNVVDAVSCFADRSPPRNCD